MSAETAPSRSSGVPLTLALIGLTIAVFLGSQIGNAGAQNKAVAFNMTNGEKQIAGAKENETALKNLIEQQAKTVEQAGAVQAEYQKLFEELLEISKDDADAKAIIDKWKIQKTDNNAAAPAAPAAEKPADKK